MAINDAYTKAVSGLADEGTLVIDGSEAGTGAVEITELGGTGDAVITKETDSDDDGVYDTVVTISTPDDEENPSQGEWHSQDNNFTVSESQNHRLVVENVSGGENDYFATGFEVDN